MDDSSSFDHVVIGGGTAGCVVAARLTEDPDRRVLLIEAGVDYLASTPPGVLDAVYVPMRGHAPEFDPQHDWGLNVRSGGDSSIAVPQAKLIGGGSAINGMIALRGATADYAEWSALGNPKWSWEEVAGTFCAMEDDAAAHEDPFGGLPTPGVHGEGGAVHIERFADGELAPLQAAFVEASIAQGVDHTWDLNAPDAHGVGPVPMTRRGPRRLSTAETHLLAARERPNLVVRDRTTVARVVFEGTRATGVVLDDGTAVRAGEVVLTAGAILTPALLQRSGVGPADVLADLGVDTVVELPVGENLGDHFSIPLMAPPAEGAWSPKDYSLQAVVRTSTSVQPGSLDAQLTMFSYLNVRTTVEGTRSLAGSSGGGVDNVAGIGCVLNKPRSTGRVRAVSTDPAELPHVDPNYLAEAVDREAIREIVRLGWSVIRSEPLASKLGPPIGMDDELVADDARLDAAIEQRTASGYHFTGTCLMAPVERGGVVDQEGLVHGTQGLRVADASVVPTTPAANSMLTTIMVAERISQAITGRTGISPARRDAP